MSNHKCLNCNKEFYVYKCRDNKVKFCSTHCKYEHKNKIGKTLEDRICAKCGITFKVEKRLLGKFCSKECYYLSKQNREERICLNCKKPFIVKKSLFVNNCSKECRTEYQKRNKIDRSFYRTQDWKKIRMRVLVRDDFKCINCGEDCMELHVHHIIEVKKGGTDTVDNLSTLCVKCHRELHSKIKEDNNV